MQFSEANEEKYNKIQTLERLKKSLMQNLLTGKKRIAKEFIDEINSKFNNNDNNPKENS
jgi:hypothetical protein